MAEKTITIDARIGAWPTIREHAETYRLSVEESRVGFFTMHFEITGEEDDLRGYVRCLANEPGIGRSVREAIHAQRRG